MVDDQEAASARPAGAALLRDEAHERQPMKPGDLELFTTEELIDELMRRTTFQGVVVHARDEAKSRHWDGERIFRVRINENLDRDEAGRLLEVVSQRMGKSEAGN